MTQNGSKAFSLGGVEGTHTWDTRSRRLSDTNPYFKSWHVSFLLHSFPLLSPSWGNLTVWINEYLSINIGVLYIFLKKKTRQGPVVFWLFLFLSYSNVTCGSFVGFPGHLTTHQGIEGFGGRWFLLHHRVLGECRSPPRRLAGRLLPP